MTTAHRWSRCLLTALLGLAACAPARRTAAPFDETLERKRIAGEAVRTAPRRAPAWQCTSSRPTPMPSPATRAERTGFCETTTYEEAMAFLDTVKANAAPNRIMELTRLGASARGRPLIGVTACARPGRSATSCAGAMTADRRRPVVLLQANIHAGEVEGKEAVLALLRTVVTDARANLLDSVTLLVIPMYNADGNEALGPQSRNRGAQLGPAVVGERANGDGLDLNRDYIKAEAPETRAMLPWLTNASVDVFVDLHTTNGSYHGYNLTWSPSLHPGAPLATFTSDTLLAGVRARLRRKGIETFPYGNFSNSFAREVTLDSQKDGWFTYDSRPRFGSNYFGLTGGISVLSEAFSHDPFDVRVRSTDAFIRELIGTIGADPSILGRVVATRRALAAGVAAKGIVLDTRMIANGPRDTVLVEDLEADRDSLAAEPGVPIGIRRTGRIQPQVMTVNDRFEPTRQSVVPAGGWLVEAADSALLTLLRRHGVIVRPRFPGSRPLSVERFQLDSVDRAARAFQGHREVRLRGRWLALRMRPAPDWNWVPAAQPQLLVAAQLLEPQSNDGATTWNLFDQRLLMGKYHPVLRVLSRPPAR